MQFLYPAFLFALLTLLIPVLIHLFSFRRYKKVYFSNVQFLRDVQQQQASRRNLKERLILASRMLALAFIVFAFARPYIKGNSDGNATGKQQVVSIFVDNSHSMEALSREGSLLDEAKQKARQIAASYPINSRFQLLTQDFEGKHQRLLNRDEFNDAVDAVKLSSQSRNVSQINERQQSLINTRAGVSAQYYVISDFQKNIVSGQANKLPAVNIVQLKANSLPNVAVDSAWLLNATHRPGESEKLVVKLRNYAEKKAIKIPLKITINGAQKAIGSFTLNAKSTQTDTLSFSGLQAGWQRGQIQLQDNPVTFDNDFYFAFNVKKQQPVLLINNGTPNKYLSALFASDPFFKVNQTGEGNVDYSALANYPLIVLSDVDAISSGLAQQLKTYVTKGGNLMFFPSAKGTIATYQSFLQPMGAAYPQALVTGDAKVSAINMQSRVFKNIFEAAPQNTDLPRVKKYFNLARGNKTGEYLMKLQTGDVIWQRFASGSGKVYVCALPLDESFSNLPVHALFVPIVLRVALLSGRDMPLFHTLGSNEVIETVPLNSSEKELVKLVKAKQTIIPDVRQQDGSTLLYLPGQLTEAGLYELKKADSTAAILAFNDNRAESDLDYLTANELSKLVGGKGNVLTGDAANTANIAVAANSAMQLWKLCIILALVCLAAETLLVRYFRTTKSKASQQV
ncbi:BatA domain-containing protein [Mucilaginibacter pallidiroseus]|nr:BatA domain-containing protein [Mucilaginibacter pallidiroseus]